MSILPWQSKEGTIMLVLGRKIGEAVQIGENLTVTIVSIDDNRVRLGFDAPREVAIFRTELLTRAASDSVLPTRPKAPILISP